MNNPKKSLALTLILPLCLTAFVHAQDPFGDEQGGGLAENTEAPAVDSAPSTNASSQGLGINERSAVVRSLRSTPPKTATELARAVQLMTRIRRWDEASYWLDQINKLGINESVAVQMVETAGSESFLRLLMADAEISDANRASVRKILDLANAASTNPKRLAVYALQLRSENKSERVQAFRGLRSAGNLGIAALLNQLLSEQGSAPNPAMCEAFSLLGKQAHLAWLAAMMTPNSDVRGRLAQLAVRLGEPALTTHLCAASVDPSIDSSVRDEFLDISRKNKKAIPTSATIHRFALNQMHRSLGEYQKNRWLDEADTFTVWRLSGDGRSVYDQSGQISDVYWQRSVEFAHAAMLTGAPADIDSAMAVAVLLENAARTSPSTATVDSVAAVLPNTMRDGFEFGCLIWDAAEKSNLASAQMLSVRNLARWASAETMPNAVRDRLSKACSSGHAAVRYAAAQSLLAAMSVQQEDGTAQFRDIRFDGRNRLERILEEMRALEGKPLALVVGGNSGLRTHARELLEAFSYRTVECTSANHTLDEIRRGQPVESIVIVDHVLEMDLGQLIQRVRACPSTSTCPIALLAASLSRGEHSVAGTDHRVVMGSVPPEQADFADILRRMKVVSQSPAVEAANRIAWSEVAKDYLVTVQGQLVAASPKNEFRPIVETPAGQLEMIAIVVDNSKPLPQREQASQIFVQSVKQFGLLISSETANAQYHEYNQRGPTEPELCVVLGRVLDAMEAAKGNRTWAEVAP